MKASINKDRGVCCFVKMESVHLSMCIECISDKTDAIGVCLKGPGKLCLGNRIMRNLDILKSFIKFVSVTYT